jgi:flagellar biogenesis protein FliO
MSPALLVRSLVSLVLVAGLLGAFVWALRRGVLRIGRLRARSAIVVETAVTLGERQSLVIVTVENRRMLLGVGSGGVSLLTDLAPGPGDRSAQP